MSLKLSFKPFAAKVEDRFACAVKDTARARF